MFEVSNTERFVAAALYLAPGLSALIFKFSCIILAKPGLDSERKPDPKPERLTELLILAVNRFSDLVRVSFEVSF